MQNLDFYAQNSLLYKNNIIFTSNHTIFKFNRSKKTLETIFKSESAIFNIIIYENIIYFRSKINNSNDIFKLDLKSYEITQITYLDSSRSIPIAASKEELIYITEGSQSKINDTFKYYIKTKQSTKLNISKIHAFVKIDKDTIYQKHQYGQLIWKNYKGGLRGVLYKNDKLLIDLPGQSLSPIYLNQRIYFIYNEENKSSIVSCNLEGNDLKYHYTNKNYLILNIHSQNDEIIFSLIGNIFIYNIKSKQVSQIQISNKRVNHKQYQKINNQYLTSTDIYNEHIALAIRGNIFEKHIYTGGLNQITTSLRFIKTGYINGTLFGFKDGKETELYIYKNKNKPTIFKLPSQKIEHIQAKDKYIAYSNHKNELHIIDIEGNNKLIDKAKEVISNFEISEDAKWIVYEHQDNIKSAIKLYSIENDKIYPLIEDIFFNHQPSFDPLNRFIAFLSNRELKLMHDGLKFDYHFDNHDSIYYIPLQPNFKLTEPWNEDLKKEKIHEINENNLININNKISKIEIPNHNNEIEKIAVVNNDKILILATEDKDKKNIIAYNSKTQTQELLIENCQTMILSLDKKNTIFLINNTIKFTKTGEKLEETGYKNQQIITNFTSIVTKQQEIQNIFDELSWLIEEFYWDQSKSSYLRSVLEKYQEHITRIETKEELHNILSQMQSEMKTSHAYIFGDNEKSQRGSLCCDIQYDNNRKKFIIAKILKPYADINHPIYSNNLDIEEGDIIRKINNIELNLTHTYNQAMLQKSDQYVTIEIKKQAKKTYKTFHVQLSNAENESKLKYLNWTNSNNEYIGEQSDNKIGYIHIPDMSVEGLKYFFINYINMYKKEALIIDIRYNRGGNVSSLILEQLCKKQLGTDIPRHHEIEPLPLYASKNKYILLMNAYTASDGEIFAESFKQLGLGKIFGERTWGGIVGICPRNHLIDNSLTSQPEFNTNFFKLTQNSIENYGVTPDINIEDIWNKESTVENDAILNKGLEFCIKKYLNKK